MAEGLALATTILSLAETVAKVVKLIQDLKNSSDEILSISNEISDIQLLVFQVQQLPLEDRNIARYLTMPIQQTERRLAKLRDVFDPICRRPKVLRPEWALSKRQVRHLLTDLRDSRSQLAAALTLSNAASNIQFNIELQGLRKTILHEFIKTQNTIKTHRSLPRYKTEVSASTTQTSRPASSNVFQIEVAGYRRAASKCSPGCPCHCHMSFCRMTPSSNLIGSIFVAMQGLTSIMFSCLPSCRSKPQNHGILVRYTFPKWLLRKLIQFRFWIDFCNQLSFSISVRNIIPEKDVWLWHAYMGNTNELQFLLNQCPSRVNDSSPAGTTAALSACIHGNYDSLTLLIQGGADLSIKYRYGSGPVQKTGSCFDFLSALYVFVATIGVKSKFLEVSRPYFNSQLEELPIPHKIVLGQSDIRLCDALGAHYETVDIRDSQGRTALWWAAATQQAVYVGKLLKYGANVNAADNMGLTPIFASLCFKNYVAPKEQGRCIRLLLRHKTECLFNRFGQSQNILHRSARCSEQGARLALIRACIRQGVDINAPDVAHVPPILYYAMEPYTTPDDFNLLLEAGANIRVQSPSNNTALMAAIAAQNRDVTALILGHGDVYLQQMDHSGQTIFHFALQYPHAGVLRELKDHGLAGLDLEAVDNYGRSPLDLFAQEEVRQQRSPEIDGLVFDMIDDYRLTRQMALYSSDEDDHEEDDDVSEYESSSDYESAPEYFDCD